MWPYAFLSLGGFWNLCGYIQGLFVGRIQHQTEGSSQCYWHQSDSRLRCPIFFYTWILSTTGCGLIRSNKQVVLVRVHMCMEESSETIQCVSENSISESVGGGFPFELVMSPLSHTSGQHSGCWKWYLLGNVENGGCGHLWSLQTPWHTLQV